MSGNGDNQEFSDKETAQRRDDAVRRALNTPPTPHKPIGKRAASPQKRTMGKGRVRVGKAKNRT